MTITRTEYAVRVKGTHRYLPRSQRRDGRGGSHLEPLDFADPDSWPRRYADGMQIRSFANKKGAKNLLASWLKGAVGCSRYGDWEDYTEENYLIPKPHRRAEDMEIVEIQIRLPDITLPDTGPWAP